MIPARSLAASVLLLTFCACKVGPNYQRPAVTLPDQYRGLAPSAPAQASAEAFGDMKWWTVFQDKALEDLIHEALTNNYDIRIAAARVAQAQAIVGVTKADQFPSISASGGIQQIKNNI